MINLKMFRILCVFALVALGASAPAVNEDAVATILNYKFTNDGEGNYEFSYETSNGIYREETGHTVNDGQEDEHIEVRGKFSYYDSDNVFHEVSYTADENGYHIEKPQPPPGVVIQPVSLPAPLIALLLGG